MEEWRREVFIATGAGRQKIRGILGEGVGTWVGFSAFLERLVLSCQHVILASHGCGSACNSLRIFSQAFSVLGLVTKKMLGLIPHVLTECAEAMVSAHAHACASFVCNLKASSISLSPSSASLLNMTKNHQPFIGSNTVIANTTQSYAHASQIPRGCNFVEGE